MVGYTFYTEKQAQEAINKINEYYGIPVSENADMQTLCTYSIDEKCFVYISYFSKLKPVLGEPTEFTPSQTQKII